MIWEAKKRCPGLVLVKARHRLYVDYHHRIIEAVDTCLPVEKVCSIDEMACRLMGREREVSAARKLAHKVKQAILQKVGERMRVRPQGVRARITRSLLKIGNKFRNAPEPFFRRFWPLILTKRVIVFIVSPIDARGQKRSILKNARTQNNAETKQPR